MRESRFKYNGLVFAPDKLEFSERAKRIYSRFSEIPREVFPIEVNKAGTPEGLVAVLQKHIGVRGFRVAGTERVLAAFRVYSVEQAQWVIGSLRGSREERDKYINSSPKLKRRIEMATKEEFDRDIGRGVNVQAISALWDATIGPGIVFSEDDETIKYKL